MWHEDAAAIQYPTESVLVGPAQAGDIYSSVGTPTLLSGGSGYSPNDILQFAGGTFDVPATVNIVSVDGSGAITAISERDDGLYTVIPTSPVATINLGFSTGAGATLAPTWTHPGGLVQLCIADPTRILLSISVGQIALAWYSTNRMTARNQGAIIVPSVYNRPWIWTYPHDGIICKLAWFAWCSVDNQAIDVLALTLPNKQCPTWRDIIRTVPVQGSITEFNHAAIDPVQASAKGVKSVFRPDWSSVSPNSGTE